MQKLSSSHQAYLERRFGARVSFREGERKLYGHDIAAMPGLFKPLIGNTVPAAVVQPESEEELMQLVTWAVANNIPLTPRGKASSGYGGVLPVKQGIVVDFYHLSRLISVDRNALTATVQPGMVWEKLDQELAKQDLTLRLYPSSYPSSTVGGWLAQGGAGIGSFESGWFRANVLSARVVAPDGTVRVFQGNDLDLISEAEGITGLISEVTIKVQPREALQLVALAAPTAGGVQKLFQAIIAEKLPIWSVIFINPTMAELKNQAPVQQHMGHPVEHKPTLPKAYVVTLAFRAKDRAAVTARVAALIQAADGQLLSDEIAQHEWENRFKLMVVKRLGPSLVPAEIVVPLATLGAAMSELEQKINQPLVKEGVLIREGSNGQPEVVILGFIPSDQRKFSYNFVFGLSLSIMAIAEKHGGRAYATGLYFGKKAPVVLGKDRLERLRAYKAQVDPQGLFNPGKVLGSGLVPAVIGLAGTFEPLIRPLGNSARVDVGERIPPQAVKDIPADVAWYAYSCSQCGYCVDECDQFYGRGWESQSPRGKWYWLREYLEGHEKWDQFQVDTFMVCTTCELCNTRCSAALPIEPSWMKLRGEMIQEEKKMTIPPFEIMAGALAQGRGYLGRLP